MQALETIGLTSAEAGMDSMEMEFSMAKNVNRMFAEMMMAHHKAAIRVAEVARKRADHDEVEQLAREITDAQQREIDVLKKYA